MKKAVALPAQCVLGAFVAALSATPCRAEDPPAFTGHIDLVSKYILRGASTTYGNALPGLGNEFADAPESDQPVRQRHERQLGLNDDAQRPLAADEPVDRIVSECISGGVLVES